MEIIKEQILRVKCPSCLAILEASSSDIHITSSDSSACNFPICNKDIYVTESNKLSKNILKVL